jgi:hypothetical protein
MVSRARNSAHPQFLLQFGKHTMLPYLLAIKGIKHANSTINRTVKDGLWPTLIEMASLDRCDNFSHIAHNQGIELVAISKLVVFALSA